MKSHPRTLILSLLLAVGFPTSFVIADVTLPAIISDHMVLQADTVAPIWGQAEPGEKVTVAIGGQTKSAVADKDGKWKVKLDPLKSGEAATLTVKGKNTITINDVLVGEVWLCSGQSNMQMGLAGQETDPVDLPQFRIFTETSFGSEKPAKSGAGKWEICTPETIKNFSGIAYFFGRNLSESLKCPVGAVVSAAGGTAIEAWTALEVQKDLPDMKPVIEKTEAAALTFDPEVARANNEKAMEAYNAAVAKAKADGTEAPRRAPRPQLHPFAKGPGGLFNGKINPLIPYAIRGAVWYQGEANAITPESGKLYATKLPMMITDWRARWGQSDFPVVWVQLPQHTGEQQGWREVRESQLKSLSLPKTGIVVTSDIKNPDPKNIHPFNKKEIGFRISQWALANVYGKNVPAGGPLPTSQEIKGSEIVCSFKHAEGLKPSEGELKGFMIAGADQKWVPATAKIAGDKVIVSSPEVTSPVAVRYAWEDVPDANLVNGAGLPASPFRSDNW